jgi:hypothetical protein
MTKQISIQGSVWFTTAEGEEIVALPVLLDLSVFSTLSAVNDTLAEMGGNRQGRFANDVIESSRSPEGDTPLLWRVRHERGGREGARARFPTEPMSSPPAQCGISGWAFRGLLSLRSRGTKYCRLTARRGVKDKENRGGDFHPVTASLSPRPPPCCAGFRCRRLPLRQHRLV